MKKRIIIIISLFVCLSSLLSSCSYISSGKENQGTLESETYIQKNDDTKIKELEAKIITLLQSQQISESERKKEISALKAEIEVLKKSDNQKNESEQITEPPSIFKYTLNGYKATITHIDADEESILIPSVIDGHAVTAIGSNAISSKKLKRVVLSEGIETLDWFAFANCPSLASVSIPASITSIGYGAFDGCSKSLTIECIKDSFGMKYAQSYGLKYNAK